MACVREWDCQFVLSLMHLMHELLTLSISCAIAVNWLIFLLIVNYLANKLPSMTYQLSNGACLLTNRQINVFISLIKCSLPFYLLTERSNLSWNVFMSKLETVLYGMIGSIVDPQKSYFLIKGYFVSLKVS